jgi:hypothetical protein
MNCAGYIPDVDRETATRKLARGMVSNLGVDFLEASAGGLKLESLWGAIRVCGHLGERIIGTATFNGAIYLKKLPNAIPAECGRGTYMLQAPYSNRQRTAMEAKWFTESPESRIEGLDHENLTQLSRLQRLVCELLIKNQRLRMKLIAERIPSGPDNGSASFEEYAVDV